MHLYQIHVLRRYYMMSRFIAQTHPWYRDDSSTVMSAMYVASSFPALTVCYVVLVHGCEQQKTGHQLERKGHSCAGRLCFGITSACIRWNASFPVYKPHKYFHARQ